MRGRLRRDAVADVRFAGPGAIDLESPGSARAPNRGAASSASAVGYASCETRARRGSIMEAKGRSRQAVEQDSTALGFWIFEDAAVRR